MCQSCNEVSINGVNCHEIGCPDSWKYYTVECKWCGILFKPDAEGQDCCSDECGADYYM